MTDTIKPVYESIFCASSNPKVLYHYFKVCGVHECGVKICDMANAGYEPAKEYAEKIWKSAKR